MTNFEDAYLRANINLAYILAEALVSVNEEGEEDNERARRLPSGSTYPKAQRKAAALRKKGDDEGALNTLKTASTRTDYLAKRRRERARHIASQSRSQYHHRACRSQLWRPPLQKHHRMQPTHISLPTHA